MYSKIRRKPQSENMETTIAEKDTGEDEQEETKRHYQKRQNKTAKSTQSQQSREFSPRSNGASSLSNLSLPINNDKSAGYIAHLLHEAELTSLVQLDTVNQIKYFLDERAHLFHQIDLRRTQYEKQYVALKSRFDETENEYERLKEQHRLMSHELSLYKNLVDAPDDPDSPTKSKDYQQLKLAINRILQENEQLHAELNHFKTSDPVYEQVQLLEMTNKDLKEELIKSKNENHRLKKIVESDEIKILKSNLKKAMEEYEKMKIINQNLVEQYQQQKSPKQEHHHQHPSSSSTFPISTQQPPLSPIPQRSSKTIDQNIVNRYPSNEVNQLREHVQRLEQTLHKRDFELQKLQNEIDKGTSSIMSSIEDLYTVSSNVSSPKSILKHQPTIVQLQNELDQLHDKLDELTRENQELKTRTQEFDTIFEENEYLYAEKSQWNEEMERARIRELVLEQEIHALKEREKEFILTNDPAITGDNANASKLKLKIDWLTQINSQLELEVARLREQIDSITTKFQQAKRDLINKSQHYKQILQAAQDAQKIPQELARIEKLNADMEARFEHERQEYEKAIAALEEQSEKREQKYSSLYDGILKLQNDYHQKELEFNQRMEDIINQRDTLLIQLTSLQKLCQQLQKENRDLEEEINTKNETNRDLKFALTSSTDDTQTIYQQMHQLQKNNIDLQKRYDQDIAERNAQIEILRTEQKKLAATYDSELFKTHQTIIQLQHENNQYSSQLERYKSNVDKLKSEINEKLKFIEQLQNDLSERSALHLTINNQLTQENKAKMAKINELEQALSQEQQHKMELQRTIHDLQTELNKSRIVAKESLEKSEEFERRFRETDKHFLHLNETTEPAKRELNTLRFELITRSDQNTVLQNMIEDEKLKRQRLEMKLKRLKDEFASVRKELYSRIEENNALQQELIEYRIKVDYYSQINNQTLLSILPCHENEQSAAVQLYLKEKADSQSWQFKCRMYQQKIEQLQKTYESTRDKYKQRIQEERAMFERTKMKYLEHMKNIQKDLHETRQLLEKDAELKISQESAYQQLVEERRQLLTTMLDKDAKVREMRRENHLLISKIQLLENQMEHLNDRVDRTLRERSHFRMDGSSLRLDSNVSIETSARASPTSPSTKRSTTYIDTNGWSQPVLYTESFGFNNDPQYEMTAVT